VKNYLRNDHGDEAWKEASVAVGDHGCDRAAVPAALPGPLTGPHQYGDVRQHDQSRTTAVSNCPLGVLWFGGSNIGCVFAHAHGHGPPEQVGGGRLFIQGRIA